MTRRGFWMPEHLATLRAMYPDHATADVARMLGRSIQAIHEKAGKQGLKKSAAFLAGDKSGRLRRGQQHPNIVANHFKPGFMPWNTGLKGWSAPNSKATQFKPGGAPVNRREVGALRINSAGGLYIKLAEGLRQWVQLSHYVWWLAHGEWPGPGMVIRYRNGDDHDTRIGNLELITRRENMLRNSAHTLYPPEVARLVQLRGALHRQINRLTQNQQQHTP